MQKIKFYPVGNGDTVFMKSGEDTVITDLHLRSNAEDETEDEYDLASDIRAECDGSLSVFINTHPDKDHISGFEDLFHTDLPELKEEESDKILVNEIWTTPYALKITGATDQAKAFVKEIKRRNKLSGEKAKEDGNRIKIISLDTKRDTSGSINDNLSWEALSPIEEHCELAEDDDSERNNTSIIIRWKFSKNNNNFFLLLAGDAEKEVWERLNEDYDNEKLSWNCLLAPHHCSRTSFGIKNDDGSYTIDENAKSAIANPIGNGWIVCSSKKPEDNKDSPPSWWARTQYINILDEAAENGTGRFLNPETYGAKELPAPVIFEMDNDDYMVLKTKGTISISSSKVFAKPQKYGLK